MGIQAFDSEGKVFSAHAEVVPMSSLLAHMPNGILRARGGSSTWTAYVSRGQAYSPRVRR